MLELSNLLTLATNESVFEEGDYSETFPSLNLAQLRKVIEFYVPDEFLPDPVPAQVKRYINGQCRQNPSVSSMALELEPVLALSPNTTTIEPIHTDDFGDDEDDYSS